MKKLMMAAGIILMSSMSFAGQDAVSICKAQKLSRLEFIKLIASSEALGMQIGPSRDVSKIEVFAISDDGQHARINVTFTGTVGEGEVQTYKAAINCDANGILELE